MHKGRLLQYMSKYRGLSEFISFNSEFRNAINLDLNLNHKGKLLSYIPTKSSIDILKRYLKAIKIIQCMLRCLLDLMVRENRICYWYC